MAAVPSPGTTGNDIIIPGDGGDTLYGDPFDVSPLSTGRGGNDRLSATGDYNSLFGDASVMSGDARGGNDRLTTTGFSSRLFGDAALMYDNARGGNDILSDTGGIYSTFFGDAGVMSGDARGGNDRLSATGHG